jgi:thioesterase domain-containing protein
LFWQLTMRMSRTYTPSSTFDGPTLIVRADARDELAPGTDGPRPRPQLARADLGWPEFVRGPITVVEVRSDHWNLLRRPAVDLVAAHISAALDG